VDVRPAVEIKAAEEPRAKRGHQPVEAGAAAGLGSPVGWPWNAGSGLRADRYRAIRHPLASARPAAPALRAGINAMLSTDSGGVKPRSAPGIELVEFVPRP
jgi:hypothetical protein